MVKTLAELFENPYVLVVEAPRLVIVVNVVSLHVVVIPLLATGVADSGKTVDAPSSEQVVSYGTVTLAEG